MWFWNVFRLFGLGLGFGYEALACEGLYRMSGVGFCRFPLFIITCLEEFLLAIWTFMRFHRFEQARLKVPAWLGNAAWHRRAAALCCSSARRHLCRSSSHCSCTSQASRECDMLENLASRHLHSRIVSALQCGARRGVPCHSSHRQSGRSPP